jgi:hypothetical protein
MQIYISGGIFYVIHNGNVYDYVTPTNAGIYTNWHIAITYNAGAIKMYINGDSLLVGESGTTPSTFPVMTNPVLRFGNPTSNYLRGNVSLFRVYSDVKSTNWVKSRNNILNGPGISFGAGSNGLTPPTIATQPIPDTAAVGQPMQFSVAATGDSLRYGWYKNSIYTGDADSVYNFNAAIADDGKYVRCVVWNGADTVWSDSAKINVVYAIIDSVGILRGPYLKGTIPYELDSVYCDNEKATIRSQSGAHANWTPASVMYDGIHPVRLYNILGVYNLNIEQKTKISGDKVTTTLRVK